MINLANREALIILVGLLVLCSILGVCQFGTFLKEKLENPPQISDKIDLITHYFSLNDVEKGAFFEKFNSELENINCGSGDDCIMMKNEFKTKYTEESKHVIDYLLMLRGQQNVPLIFGEFDAILTDIQNDALRV